MKTNGPRGGRNNNNSSNNNNNSNNSNNKLNNNNNKHTIFIGWSGDSSRKVAEELKKTLEEIFPKKINCFVSTQNIASGEDWYRRIKRNLERSSLGILCITKENIKAPWLYFEAGALVRNNMKVIPLLINCSPPSLDNTPIQVKQSIQFNRPEQFKKMLKDIRDQFNLAQDTTDTVLDGIYSEQYNTMKKNLNATLEELKNKRRVNESFIYPSEVTTITKDTVYISAPMSNVPREEYEKQQNNLKELIRELEEKNIKTNHCPAAYLDYDEFQGITTAVNENYSKLKQAQHLLVIYPRAMPTSALIEIGYGIALSKNTIVFHKEELPYMLKDAGQDIVHLHTRPYADFSEIITTIGRDNILFKERRFE